MRGDLPVWFRASLDCASRNGNFGGWSVNCMPNPNPPSATGPNTCTVIIPSGTDPTNITVGAIFNLSINRSQAREAALAGGFSASGVRIEDCRRIQAPDALWSWSATGSWHRRPRGRLVAVSFEHDDPPVWNSSPLPLQSAATHRAGLLACFSFKGCGSRAARR